LANSRIKVIIKLEEYCLSATEESYFSVWKCIDPTINLGVNQSVVEF
jgi:hypothetical protein